MNTKSKAPLPGGNNKEILEKLVEPYLLLFVLFVIYLLCVFGYDFED